MVLEAIQIRNGISLSVHQRSSYVTLDAYSKGCFQIAPGIVVYNHLLNKYISVFPPLHLHRLHIYDLELLAHVLVAQVWGPQFVSQHVQIFTDNIACFCLVSKGRSAFDNRLRMAKELNPPVSRPRIIGSLMLTPGRLIRNVSKSSRIS